MSGTDIDFAALRAVAENPLVAPSKRVEARKALRAYREAQAEAATAASGMRRIRTKIATGGDLTGAEAATATAMGLLDGRD